MMLLSLASRVSSRRCTRTVSSCLCERRQFLSASSTVDPSSPLLSRYGLGGHLWSRFDPTGYRELIHKALSKKVSYLEVAGKEGGDVAMVGGMLSALEQSPELADQPLTITTRLGYRTLQPRAVAEGSEPVFVAGDVLVIEDDGDGNKNGGTALNDSQSNSSSNVVHNLSSDYILKELEGSPLFELQDLHKNVKFVFLIHNPEQQVLELLKHEPKSDRRHRQAYIQQQWEPALKTLQEFSAASQGRVSFGVVSNGLGIPAENDHPMYLDSDLVIDSAKTYDRFQTVELPANLLERTGWDMARKIYSALPTMNIIAMRPLTCYPDLGTGTGHPFRLADYSLPSLDEHGGIDVTDTLEPDGSLTTKKERYTNEMSGFPAIYQIALQAAMSHFDAEEILEIKQERELNMEERETLDGCKLVQSMIHDLDTDLEHIRSFAAHEDELYGRIIPLLHDTFEALDDRTSDVLQAYFAAYGVAVRYAIAKKTRQALKEGEIEGSKYTYPDIPQSMTLQEYALRKMSSEPCFSRLVVGATTIHDFEDTSSIMQKISKDDDPLDAIVKANEREAEAKE